MRIPTVNTASHLRVWSQKVADVVKVDGNQATFLGAFQHALAERAGKHVREECENSNIHSVIESRFVPARPQDCVLDLHA